MKKLLIIAAILVGANLSYGQAVPLTFKTSSGSTIGASGATSAVIYADVTNTGSSSVVGVATYYNSSTTYKNNGAIVVPVVSVDGTNFTQIKSGGSWYQFTGEAATTYYFKPVFDTLFKGTATIDTVAGSASYKFPAGYKYVGFKIFVATASSSSAITAKGLAK